MFYDKEIFDELDSSISKYKEKFGEDSLERCIEFMFDPIYPEKKLVLKAINTINKAIKHNKPLEQMDEEVYKTIRF